MSPTVEIEGRQLSLTNLDKVLWPQTGFTKGQMIDYYARVAPALLPHLRGRPLTMRRFPDGVQDGHWYQKECYNHPPWLPTRPVPSTVIEGKIVDYCVVNDLPSLLWVANLATVELHPLLGTEDDVERPTALAFDLDPGAPADILDCSEVALWLREALDALGLARTYPKTSGSKGLQVFVPLHADVTYAQTKPFAHALARVLEREHPDRVVERMAKKLRPGKVLVDWSQNDPSKSTVAAYSLRARARPTVSTPVTWDEVESALAERDASRLVFGPDDVLERLDRHGDLFEPVLGAPGAARPGDRRGRGRRGGRGRRQPAVSPTGQETPVPPSPQ